MWWLRTRTRFHEIKEVLDECSHGSLRMLYGLFFMREKSKHYVSGYFFSISKMCIRRQALARHRLRTMQCIACWEKNKQACHQSWEESLVQHYCQNAASISYIINIT